MLTARLITGLKLWLKDRQTRRRDNQAIEFLLHTKSREYFDIGATRGAVYLARDLIGNKPNEKEGGNTSRHERSNMSHTKLSSEGDR